MSGNISDLLPAISAGKDNLEVVEFDDKKSASDTSKIFEMQRKYDISGLLSFWKEKSKKSFFELSHPESNVRTRAVYGVQYGMANFVFMIDANGSNIWVLAQCVSLIDVAITGKNIYKSACGNAAPILSHIEKLSCVKFSDLDYRNSGFGFLLSQARPYHHFYDQLKFLLSFESNKLVAEKRSFFFPAESEVKKMDAGVFFFPNAVGNNFINQKNSFLIKNLNENMEDFVYKDALLHIECERGKVRKDGWLALWFGITGQKRSWLEQVEGCINIVKMLRLHFEGVVLYIDGMTAMQGERLVNEEDEAVYREIKKRLIEAKGVEVHPLVGWDYRDKIACCDSVDMFIANAGTGCMVPLRFVKKPGVLHSNTKLFTFPGEYPDYIKRAHNSYVLDVANGVTDAAMHVSYHIPWQHIFNLAAEVLNQIKGSNIKPLEVPPVEEVAKAYEVQEQAKKQKLMAFAAIEHRVKPQHKSPDILREVALSFEHSGDVQTALEIMKKALELRPAGPFIRKKVIEYQAIIESANQKVKR